MDKDSKLVHIRKWLSPGMRIKRWVIIFILGICGLAISVAGFLSATLVTDKIINSFLLLLSFIAVYLGAGHFIDNIVAIFLPYKERDLVNIIYQKRNLDKGPKIVTVGGGTGLSVLLEGLKEYTSNITAIVTVADDGGSSGRLREQFDILPPGDIRNCLVALADTGPLMQKLFQFRFDGQSEFSGHNFGNLFITVMTKLTGDFEKAIKESSKVLAIRGQVIPSTLSKVSLVAEHKDGSFTEGEAQIPKNLKPIKRLYLKPESVLATPEALKAIEEADAIVLGPGSLYTSIIPNLLIKEIADAVAEASCLKIYVCNVMTQQGETDGYSASKHVETLINHSHKNVLNHCIVNNSNIPQGLLIKYKEEGSFPVKNDEEVIRKMGYKVIEDNIISTVDFVRHNSGRLTRVIINLVERQRSFAKSVRYNI